MSNTSLSRGSLIFSMRYSVTFGLAMAAAIAREIRAPRKYGFVRTAHELHPLLMPAASAMTDGPIPDGSPVAASLEVLLAQKTCRRCYHLVKNGIKSGNIHSTLAYAKCRCHRNWKYLMPAPELPEHIRESRTASARRRNAVPRPRMLPGGPYSGEEPADSAGKPVQLQNGPSVAPGVKQSHQTESKPSAVVGEKLPVLSKRSVVLQSSNCSPLGKECSSSTSDNRQATSSVCSSSSKSDTTTSVQHEPNLTSLKLSPVHSSIRLSPTPSTIKMPQITRLDLTPTHSVMHMHASSCFNLYSGPLICMAASDSSQDHHNQPGTLPLPAFHKWNSTFEVVLLSHINIANAY